MKHLFCVILIGLSFCATQESSAISFLSTSLHLRYKYCFYVLPYESQSDELLELEVVTISGISESPDFRFVVSPLRLESSSANVRTVLVWSRLEDLLDYSGSEEWSWSQHKNEHYVLNVNSFDSIKIYMADTALRLDAKVFFMLRDGRTFESYRKGTELSRKSPLVIQEVCGVDSCNPMDHIWNRRSDLTGLHLRAAYNTYVPLAMEDQLSGSLTGYFPDLFYRLQEVLNFTYTPLPSVDGSHGGQNPKDGSWTGVVGMLHRKEADMNIGGQTIRFDRAQVNDLSMVVLTDSLAVFFRSQDSYDLNIYQIIAIFQRDTFAALCTLLAGLVAGLTAIYHALNTVVKVYICLMYSAASVGNTLISRHFDPDSCRRGKYAKEVFFLTAGLLGVVLFAHLRAGLLLNLAVKNRNLHLNNWTDLRDKEIRLMVHAGGSMHSFLKKSLPGTLPHRLYKENVEPYGDDTLGTKSVIKALNRVASDSRYAYLLHLNTARISPLYPCSIIELPDQRLSGVQMTFGYQKDSSLREMFDFFLSRMVASGVVQKTWKRYYDTSTAETDCAAELDLRLDFGSLFGLFLILILGAGISAVLVFAEECIYVANRGHRHKNIEQDGRSTSSQVRGEPLSWEDLLEIISQQRMLLEQQAKVIKQAKIAVNSKAHEQKTPP